MAMVGVGFMLTPQNGREKSVLFELEVRSGPQTERCESVQWRNQHFLLEIDRKCVSLALITLIDVIV